MQGPPPPFMSAAVSADCRERARETASALASREAASSSIISATPADASRARCDWFDADAASRRFPSRRYRGYVDRNCHSAADLSSEDVATSVASVSGARSVPAATAAGASPCVPAP